VPRSESPGAGRRPIEADDLFRIALVSDPQAEPGGARIAYVVTRLDKDADEYRSAIWTVDLEGGEPRQLTSGAARDTAPRWSPDGKEIAFVSTRDPQTLPDTAAGDNGKPKPQVWVVPVDGGEARQLTNRPLGATAPAWSPDGRTVAFLSAVEAKDDRERPNVPDSVADERVIEDIRYRHDGRGFVAGKRAHVWTIPAAGGEPRQLTFGDVDDEQIAWSPDGRLIAFVANRSEGRALNSRSAIYAVPAQGGEVRTLAEAEARFHSPAWSPDGSRIAFLGHLQERSGPIDRVWTVPAAGGDPVCHTAELDVSFADEGMSDLFQGSDVRPVWAADGNSLFVLASRRGATDVWRVDPAANEARPVTSGDHRPAAFAVAGKRLAYVAGEIGRPFELRTCTLHGKGVETLPGHNDAFLGEVALDPGEEIIFRSAAGDRDIQGWILKPPGFDPEVAHPAIVQIHGGPHAMYGHAMFHEMQLMAARGYVVMFTNPRGSAGYGEEFATCTRGAWGVSDMPDIMGALDALLATGYVDPVRVGVTGGSYGGYLTNWLVGHTDRFRAAVTQRCVSNFHSMYGTSDIGFDFGEDEFGGTPWSDTERLLAHSPISFVDRIGTPLLIVHNEGDLRCPIEQAEQLFTALKRLGRKTRFVRIPEEDHNLSRTGKPSRRLARLHHLIGWFDSHL